MNEKRFDKNEQRGDDKAGANRPRDGAAPQCSLTGRFAPVVIGIVVGSLGTVLLMSLLGRDSSLPVAKNAGNATTPVAATPMVTPPEPATPATVTPVAATPATAGPAATQPAFTMMPLAPPGTPPINNVDPVSGEKITPTSPATLYKGHVVAFCCRNSKGFNGGWQKMSEADKDAFVSRWVK